MCKNGGWKRGWQWNSSGICKEGKGAEAREAGSGILVGYVWICKEGKGLVVAYVWICVFGWVVGCGYVGNLNKVGSGMCGVCVYVRQDVGIDSSDVFLALAKEITKKIEFSNAPRQFGIVIKWCSFNFFIRGEVIKFLKFLCSTPFLIFMSFQL